jgi:hypothetical protein
MEVYVPIQKEHAVMNMCVRGHVFVS